jgi:hypothetical protein
MPCGGIYPTTKSDAPCLFCGGPGSDHVCIEWDGMLHGECVEQFLGTHMGETIIEHAHWVIVDMNGSGNRKIVRKGAAMEYFVTEDDVQSTISRKA